MNQNTKNLLGIGTLAAAGFLLAKQSARRARAFDLTGKVVLITGATRGLGLVLAREFAKHGARIAICARDQSELEHVVDEFAWMGENFLAVTCDVTVRENVETMAMQPCSAPSTSSSTTPAPSSSAPSKINPSTLSRTP